MTVLLSQSSVAHEFLCMTQSVSRSDTMDVVGSKALEQMLKYSRPSSAN